MDYDGRYVWLATGDKLQALDPASGEIQQTLNVAADAGTAFDDLPFPKIPFRPFAPWAAVALTRWHAWQDARDDRRRR